MLSEPAAPAGSKDISFHGLLYPRKDITITARISGLIAEVLIREGGKVRKDEILLKLSTGEVDRKFRLANIELQRSKIKYERALSKYNRMRRKDSEDDDNALEAKRELRMEELAVKEAELNCEQARVNLESAIVRSPFDGTIASINKDVGNSVATGEELVRVVNSQELLLVAEIKVENFGSIKTGMEISFLADYSNEAFRTRVDSIVPIASGDDTFKITAVVPNRNIRLLPGTKVSCVIKTR